MQDFVYTSIQSQNRVRCHSSQFAPHVLQPFYDATLGEAPKASITFKNTMLKSLRYALATCCFAASVGYISKKRVIEMVRMSGAVLCMLMLTGCGGSPANSGIFNLQVHRDSGNDENHQQAKVEFDLPLRATVDVEWGANRASVLATGDALRDGAVMLTVDRKTEATEDNSQIESRVEVVIDSGTSRSSSVGHSIETVESQTPLSAILNLTAVDGAYPLDTPLTIGMLNGKELTLLIRTEK